MKIAPFILQDENGEWYQAPGALVAQVLLDEYTAHDLLLATEECDTLLDSVQMVEAYGHPFVSFDGSVCFDDYIGVEGDFRRDQAELQRPGAKVIAVLRATSHLLRRGYFGGELGPFRPLSQSRFRRIPAAEAERARIAGVQVYEYQRERRGQEE